METLVMSKQERRRAEVLTLVRAGTLTLTRAAELLEVSYR